MNQGPFQPPPQQPQGWPPPGGPPGYAPQGYPPPPRKSNASPWLIALIAIPMACVVGIGILSAIAIPAFSRYTRRTKTSESVANLASMCSGVRSYAMAASERGGGVSLPPSAPRTPAQVPAGVREQVPPSAWRGNTWELLGFSPIGPQHYSYEFVNQGSTFVLRANGDLDGDGILSTFERTGSITPTGEVECGALSIQNELE